MKPLANVPFHLAYCTNIHPAETWEETFHALKSHTLRLRDRVSPGQTYAIGLRLSALAAHELRKDAQLHEFRKWLDRENCYVFTINGFPYGQFHGRRVKENVYRPDWTTTERLDYTTDLFAILTKILPKGVEGSVSTLPGSFKEFDLESNAEILMFQNIWECARRMADLSETSEKKIHLGFEPEPLGWFETSSETIEFFSRLREHPSARQEWFPMLGVNYDTCHLALEFEEPDVAIQSFLDAEIRISKIHLSSALKANLTQETIAGLADFIEPTYLHQVIVQTASGQLTRYRDLPDALGQLSPDPLSEARIHFHVPLHWQPEGFLNTTIDHTEKTLHMLLKNPQICSHLEIETYTWQVLPEQLRAADVVDQIEREYAVVLHLLQS